MIDLLIHYFAEMLKFSRTYILLYSLPTNPISSIIYLGFSYYGYSKLKARINLDLSKLSNKVLVFIYSACLLSCINFLFENVWLTSFLGRYYTWNHGWLDSLYFNAPSGWFVNYLRNCVYFIVLYIISRDILNYVNVNKHTVIGSMALSLYLVGMFFLTPHYGYIDWTYAIMWNLPEWEIVLGFMLSVLGKPLLFYVYYSLWMPNPKKVHQVHCLTLDVGCGSRPQGEVNVDILEVESDPLQYNIQNKRNFSPVVVHVPNLIVADARFLPFRDKAFPKSFCYHLLEHISEDWMVCEELDRVTNGEIEIRVPFKMFEDLFDFIFWYKQTRKWREKYHVRSYSKQSFSQSLTPFFQDHKISLSYGYLSFWRAIHFELERNTRFPFPFPFEIIANISLEES